MMVWVLSISLSIAALILQYDITLKQLPSKLESTLPTISVYYARLIYRRLTQKYSIAVGVPTLVIRGRAVRDALLSDPKGERFPWPAPPLDEVLRGVELEGEQKILYEQLPPDAVRVFYFAAHWCPPCRSFAPSLCAALSAVRKRRSKYANTQLILVSSDRSVGMYFVPNSLLT
ncbi:unnamed protein product [Euphydryas editha]|uniref:Thioredoxin domain-containing protein n=1 Tax=Euphydryas editha TaxID=104508 RepID=A0AAU9U2E6_EUPED|nr:unnamed protein product [Euphydryas editha]